MAAAKSNTTSVYFTNSTNSKHGVKKEVLSFTRVDACLIVHSLTALFIDIITDFILVVIYFMNGYIFWGYCTLALVIIPAVIMQGFSLRWHILDGSSGKGLFVAHICLLGVFLRYIGVLHAGQEARRSREVTHFQLFFHQQSDLCMLHLFESFMESAPQIVLQFYIAVQFQHWSVWTGISVATSMLSLTWAVLSYSRVMRRVHPEKQHISLCGLILQTIWRVGMVSARITALVLFAICCQAWLFLLLGLHWLGMTVWVVLQKTDPNATSWEEYAYNAVVGVMYCFCFFNLREGRARARMLAFYVVTVAQNLACLYLFLALKQHAYPFLAQFSAITVVCGTVIGLGAMLLYYRFCHPSGPISFFGAAAVSDRQSRPNQTERTVRSPSPPKAVTSQQKSQHSEPESTNSLRCLKHLWAVDRDGSLSSRSDDMPLHGGSPQSDDGYTDKRLLLSARCSSVPRRPIPSFGRSSTRSHEATAVPPAQVQPIQSTRVEKPASPTRTVISIEDSQISWNCPSLMEDTRISEAMEPEPQISVVTTERTETEGSCGLNKRRAICSSVELGLDLDLLEDQDKDSFASLCQKLVSVADVKQLVANETGAKRSTKAKLCDDGEKRESDYIDSKVSEVQSSDGTPSEVLSAHDYENICAVNIAREAWGLRSWRGYSDIETWLHDDSVVRDRRRDTLMSVATTTTASSERSTASESPPPTRLQWEIAPPLPSRRPRPSYNRMDDYLDTLAYDLAEIERRESVCYAVDPIYSIPLDTIMEELEESSCTSTASVPAGPAWASSLVATIDEIRTGTRTMSLCNTFDDTLTVSEGDFDVGSYHSLQFDTSGDQRLRFSYSLPSLLQAPKSWSHVTTEEWLSKPESEASPTKVADSPLKFRLCEENLRRSGHRPRRRFSLLRERFEKPMLKAEVDEKGEGTAETANVCAGGDVDVEDGDSKSSRSHHWSSYTKMQNRCNAQESPLKKAVSAVDPFGNQGGQSVLKRVLTPPKLHRHNKSLVIASNASA